MVSATRLFTYGTLMFPEIWEAIVGVSADLMDPREATLADYEIRRFSGYDFPGIFESTRTDAEVPGIVYSGLNPEMIAALDQYEDTAYFRDEVEITLDTSERIRAQTYIVRPTHRDQLSSEQWTASWFAKDARSAYFARLRGEPV